jgi:hypothetical protein
VAAGIEATIAIAHAGFGFFGLCMSKQHQSHAASIDLLPAAV